jgi:hypothetical protein
MFRKIRCLLQCCPFQTQSDETGCWGECVDCGKRVGFVTSEQLRRYADSDTRRRLEPKE